MPSAYVFTDCNGETLAVGSKVNGGDGDSGRVVELYEPDENWGSLAVEWPEWPGDPEVFTGSPASFNVDETHLRFSDVEVVR